MTLLSPIIQMCLLMVHEQGEKALPTICRCKIPRQTLVMESNRLKVFVDDFESAELMDFVMTNMPDLSPREQFESMVAIKLISHLL